MKTIYDDKQYWQTMPSELKFLCLASVHGTGSRYCTEPILDFLIDHMDDYKYIAERTVYDEIKQIDIGIEFALIPFELHDWSKHKEKIEKILTQFEKLIFKHKSSKKSPDKSYELDFFYQKLNIYYCALYMFTSDFEKVKKHLDILLEISMENIEHLSDEDTIAYDSGGDVNYNYPGVDFDCLEPINYFSREILPNTTAKELYIACYKKYVDFLWINSSSNDNFETLFNKSQECLQRLYETSGIEQDDCLPDEEYTEEYKVDW